MIEASKSGLPVPPAPINKEEFMLVQRGGANISPAIAAQYTELVKLMRQQHEMCISYSKQFTHLGNITETIKFEKMAEDCKKNMDILKQAHAKGFPLPKYHYSSGLSKWLQVLDILIKFLSKPQQLTIQKKLNSNDMILSIVKGINLPAPPGISPDDLDAFVRFEFPYPNAEEAQKDKTNVVKNSNCPEFQEKFKLYINRSHRGFKRAIQSKGIKFEVAHKGGLFKNDPFGWSTTHRRQVRSDCRLREPLTSQQLETTNGEVAGHRSSHWAPIQFHFPAAHPEAKPQAISSEKGWVESFTFRRVSLGLETSEPATLIALMGLVSLYLIRGSLWDVKGRIASNPVNSTDIRKTIAP
ncbi:putative Coiled-coil and C2 domain-containing protein, partial [Naja naja]